MYVAHLFEAKLFTLQMQCGDAQWMRMHDQTSKRSGPH